MPLFRVAGPHPQRSARGAPTPGPGFGTPGPGGTQVRSRWRLVVGKVNELTRTAARAIRDKRLAKVWAAVQRRLRPVQPHRSEAREASIRGLGSGSDSG